MGGVRTIGLKDVYVAKVLTNTSSSYTTDTPQKLFNAITAKITEKRSSEDFYDDDKKSGTVAGTPQIGIEFEGDLLSMAARAYIFGKKLVKGMLTSNDNDEIPELAFGFRAKNSDGKYIFRWFYCGKFNEGITDSYETNADKPKVQTSGTISGSFYGRQKDSNSDVMINETELATTDTDAKTVITNWFSKVQEPIVASS